MPTGVRYPDPPQTIRSLSQPSEGPHPSLYFVKPLLATVHIVRDDLVPDLQVFSRGEKKEIPLGEASSPPPSLSESWCEKTGLTLWKHYLFWLWYEDMKVA